MLQSVKIVTPRPTLGLPNVSTFKKERFKKNIFVFTNYNATCTMHRPIKQS